MKTYKKRRPRRRATKKTHMEPNYRISSVKKNMPLATRFKCRMRYSEPNLRITPSAGGIAGVHLFSANGLWDPNVTGTGHQPGGWDQLIGLYQHGTVIGAKLTATFTNKNPNDPYICGVEVDGNTTVTRDIREYIEQGTCKFASVGGVNTGSNSQVTMTYNLNPNKFLGLRNPLDNSNLRNTVSSNPTEQVYFIIFAANQDNLDIVNSEVFVAVDIEYQVVFTEPKHLGIS